MGFLQRRVCLAPENLSSSLRVPADEVHHLPGPRNLLGGQRPGGQSKNRNRNTPYAIFCEPEVLRSRLDGVRRRHERKITSDRWSGGPFERGFRLSQNIHITLLVPAKAGAVELQPGQYKVKIEGAQAVFTDVHNKSITVPAMVENADKKFGYTAVETANKDGTNTIQAIDIGDSKIRVKLRQ